MYPIILGVYNTSQYSSIFIEHSTPLKYIEFDLNYYPL